MKKDLGLKVGDPVVADFPRENRRRQGEVIFTTRDHKYGHSIIVLLDNSDIETFMPDGTRYVGDITIKPGKVRK